MKSKLGIIMVLMCVLSFVLYQYGKDKKSGTGSAENVLSKEFVEGIVVNKVTSAPIKDVMIGKRGYNPTASTDAEGHFYIEAKTSDELLLKKDGFIPIIISADKTERIEMEPKPTE